MTSRLRTRASRLGAGLVLTAAVFALAPAVAAANTITSRNWSGYAVHRSGVKFKKVVGSWHQPGGSCVPGSDSYSAFWIGIGGYSLNSQALEQAGTELDCNANGTRSIFAWYELVPSATRTIRMTIEGGDLLKASVTVVSKRVTITLADVTRHESFTKAVNVAAVDTGSAEWIAEAPSDCSSSNSCSALTLADFGQVGFTGARAETTKGRSGAIKSSLWNTTKILLGYSIRSGVLVATATAGHATPSALTRAGGAFTVTYTPATSSSGSATTGGGTDSGSPNPGTGPGGALPG